MTPEPSFFRLALRQFWVPFGAIFFLVGAGLLAAFAAAAPTENELPWVLPLVGAVFGGLGAFFLVKGLRRVQTIRRLFREGVRTEATVTGVEQTNVSINRVRQWVVRFTFRDLAGVTQEGVSEYMSPNDAEQWQPGDVGQICYDSHDPTVHYWIGRESHE